MNKEIIDQLNSDTLFLTRKLHHMGGQMQFELLDVVLDIKKEVIFIKVRAPSQILKRKDVTFNEIKTNVVNLLPENLISYRLKIVEESEPDFANL